jgi:hypothetical protein
MSILRYLRALWDDSAWTHQQFAVALILGVLFFGGSLSYMAYDNRASVVQAENARRAVRK